MFFFNLLGKNSIQDKSKRIVRGVDGIFQKEIIGRAINNIRKHSKIPIKSKLKRIVE